MIRTLKEKTVKLLRWSEKYTKTDMLYFARGGFWMNASFVVVNIMAFGLSIAFARFLPKEVYGTYQFILSIGSILTSLTLTGMNTAITQAVAKEKEGTLQKSIPLQLRYNLFATLGAVLISTYYFLQGNSTIGFGVLLIGLFIPVYNAFNTYSSLLSGRKNFRGGFFFGLFLALPYYAVMIVSLIFIKDPVGLILVNFGVNTLVTLILYLLAIKIYKPNDSVDYESISYGKHLSLANIIATVGAQMDNIFVFHFLGNAELAIYAFASTVPERVSSLIKMVTNMALPKFATKTPAEIKKTIVSKSLRLAGGFLLIAIAYYFLADVLFKVLFPKYVEAVAYSQGYAFMLALGALASLPFTALSAMQAKKEIYTYNIVTPIFGVVVMAIMTMSHGVWGLIIGKSISSVANYVISVILINKVSSR